MTLRDLALPYLLKFIDSPKKRKILLAARQIGKSWTLAFIAVVKCLSKKGGLSLIISTGARASSEIMKKVALFAEAVQVMSGNRFKFFASSDCIKFNNGSRVLALPSGNPAALRGYTAIATIIDECAYIERPSDVFAAILPTLTRDPNAELIVASTPAGKHCPFFDLWQKATNDPEWYAQATDIYDAKEAGLDIDIEALKSLCPDPDIFLMEYECKFADQYGAFIDTNILEYAPEAPGCSLESWIGMDVGSNSDRSAIVEVILEKDGTYLVNDATILHKTSYEDLIKIVKELYNKKKWNAGYVDENGIGSALAEFLNKQVSTRIKGFTWTGANKTPSYENLRALIFDHKIKFAERLKPLVILDFNNVSRIVNEAGNVKYVAGRDENGHSDFTSALVLALQAAKDNPVNFKAPQGWHYPTVFSRSKFL